MSSVVVCARHTQKKWGGATKWRGVRLFWVITGLPRPYHNSGPYDYENASVIVTLAMVTEP